MYMCMYIYTHTHVCVYVYVHICRSRRFTDDPPSSIWRGRKFAIWRPPQTIDLRSDAGGEGAVFGDEERIVREDRVGEDKIVTGRAFGKERLPAMKNIFLPLPAKQIFLKSQYGGL